MRELRVATFQKNARTAYTVNSVTAKTNVDGSVTIQFGGDETGSSYLSIMPGMESRMLRAT